jgi:hypothetical protein
MKYFVKTHKTYAPKNKLEKSIQDALIIHDGTLLEHTMLEAFKRELHDTVARLNREHSRCSGKEVKSFKFQDNEQVYVQDVIYLDAFSVKVSR